MGFAAVNTITPGPGYERSWSVHAGLLGDSQANSCRNQHLAARERLAYITGTRRPATLPVNVLDDNFHCTFEITCIPPE
jgi:hypothetical protein